jgi:ribosomal protein S18 acetylase RimI-like enzyme
MNGRASVRPFLAVEWESYRDLRLRALEDAPDAFGATLEDAQVRPQSFWAERLQSGIDSGLDQPLCAFFDGEPIGLAWGLIEPTDLEQAHLFQMWVAPQHRGRGIGRMLLDEIVAWARQRRARLLTLSVTLGSSAAMRMYLDAGFEPFGEPEPLRPRSPLLVQPMRLRLAQQP